MDKRVIIKMCSMFMVEQKKNVFVAKVELKGLKLIKEALTFAVNVKNKIKI
jgi:hypothetical protein